jgi:hypothetical protein
VLKLIDAGALTKGHGKALLAEPDDTRRIELAQRAADEGWPIRRLTSAIAKPPAPARNTTSAAPADDVAHELARPPHRAVDRRHGDRTGDPPRL